jgi:uncharacterized membrane protein
VVLVVAILAAGALYYIITALEREAGLTSFSITGVDGTTDYPERLAVGEEGRVVVGIGNQEGEPVSYRLEIVINGVSHSEVAVTLADGQEWAEEMGFVTSAAGENQKVEFLLFKEGQDEAYHRLHLFIDVT